MADPRVLKLAQVLVNYSLALKPGDKLRMSSGVSALPLLREVYREATRAGAFLITRITDAEFEEILLKEGSDDQLAFVSDPQRQEVEYIDASLSVWSEGNTKQLSNVDPQRLALRRKASAPLTKRFMQRFGAKGTPNSGATSAGRG